jgi:hypothetical protein
VQKTVPAIPPFKNLFGEKHLGVIFGPVRIYTLAQEKIANGRTISFTKSLERICGGSAVFPLDDIKHQSPLCCWKTLGRLGMAVITHRITSIFGSRKRNTSVRAYSQAGKPRPVFENGRGLLNNLPAARRS